MREKRGRRRPTRKWPRVFSYAAPSSRPRDPTMRALPKTAYGGVLTSLSGTPPGTLLRHRVQLVGDLPARLFRPFLLSPDRVSALPPSASKKHDLKISTENRSLALLPLTCCRSLTRPDGPKANRPVAPVLLARRGRHRRQHWRPWRGSLGAAEAAEDGSTLRRGPQHGACRAGESEKWGRRSIFLAQNRSCLPRGWWASVCRAV